MAYRAAAARGAARAGSAHVAIVPPPGRGPSVSVPPCAARISAQSGKPEAASAAPAARSRRERQRGAPHRLLVHAGPAVEDAEDRSVPRRGLDGDGDLAGGAAGLRRVLEEVQEHLLDLGGIEDGGRGLGGSEDAERNGAPHGVEERRPENGFGRRRRDPRERRVAFHETREVADALLDRREDLVETAGVPAVRGGESGRMHEGADGRERVVHLVAHDADDLAPGLQLLAAHVAREGLHDDEAVPLRVEVEGAHGDPPGLLLVPSGAGRDGCVRAREERLPKRSGRLDLV